VSSSVIVLTNKPVRLEALVGLDGAVDIVSNWYFKEERENNEKEKETKKEVLVNSQGEAADRHVSHGKKGDQ
jgi:hypothetical protein